MIDEQVSIEPQIIQFTQEVHQTIKVTNNTSRYLKDCFFCLFNVQKYQFSPQFFSLEPNQQKLITVSLKLTLSRNVSKEFAYLKSENVNKRITLLANNFESPSGKFMSPGSGTEEIYTLSSRDYKDTQTSAYQKIISEKEAIIERLQRQIQERQSSMKKTNLPQRSKNFYIGQIEGLEIKIDLLGKEKEGLIRENVMLQNKLEELDRKKVNEKIKQSDEQVHYLETRCEEYLNTISEKQAKIRQVEGCNLRMKEQLRKDNEKRIQNLEIKLEQQKKYYEESFQSYLQTIKELEASASQSQQFREQSISFEKDMKIKVDEILRLKQKLEKQQKKSLNFEDQQKNLMKINILNASLEEKNKQLNEKVKNLQKINHELKQQTIISQNKINQEPSDKSDKAGQFLEVALQSCRSQNQMLRKSKVQLQKSLTDETYLKNIHESKSKELEKQIVKIQEQLNFLKESNASLIAEKNKIKQQNHQLVISLKEQNLSLLEKVTLAPKQQIRKKQIHLQQIQNKLSEKTKECEEKSIIEEKLREKIMDLQQKYDKVSKKINKYKKQAKQELKSLNETAVEQLRRVHEQKKKLNKRIIEMEESLNNSENHDKTRNKIKSKGQNSTIQHKTRHPRSESEKRGGIKNQRNDFQDSQINSRHDIDYQSLYCQLGQLRELKNYIKTEQERFQRLFGINTQQMKNDQKNPIFYAISFFKNIQEKFREDETQTKNAEREAQYLRSQLTQFQNKTRQKLNQISVLEMNKTVKSETDKALLEYIRDQMKTQFKKMHDSLKLSEDKYHLLKKKIYQEYRARIIDILCKKDKQSIAKIESTLQRFIEGLSNVTHKEAILQKQIKLKQVARKQVSNLKQKNSYLNQLLENKKGYCTRQPVKIFPCQNQSQWHDNLRLEAKLLTYQAQNTRLKQEISLQKNIFKATEEQLTNCLEDLESKENQIIKLKREVIQISDTSEKEKNKNLLEIQTLKEKYLKMQKIESQLSNLQQKEKQYSLLKEDLSRKKQIIKHLKQKEKMLEQLLQSSQRNENSEKEREKREVYEISRTQQALRDLKDANREIRAENNRLKERNDTLQEENKKKNAQIKRMKGQTEDHRIRTAKNQQIQACRLSKQNSELKQEIKKNKDDLEKYKKKKDRETISLQNELQKIKNEQIIQVKSLQSIIRALIDTIRRIYSAIELTARKRGIKSLNSPDFEDLLDNPSEVDSLKVYESFEKLLEILKDSELE